MTRRSARAPLVGRRSDLARLEAALVRARTGDAGLVLLAGEAGIGKTRLLDEVLGREAAAGSVVIVGGCPVARDDEIPFAPIIEGLRTLVRSLPPEQREAIVGPGVSELSALLPGLGAGRPDDAFAGSTRLFEAVLGLLDRAAEAHPPAILAVEDLHWADRSTRDLLAFLVRNLRGRAVLLLGTVRSDAVPGDHPLRRLLAELERVEGVERIELARLGRDDLAELLAASHPDGLGEANPEAVWRRSEGNPFFALELADRAADGAANELPSTVRELLLSRLTDLPRESQELLRSAAVAGRAVRHDLLAAALQWPEALLVAAIRETVRHQILVPIADEGGDGYAFRHGLIREAIADDLLPGERARIHRALAVALASHPGLSMRDGKERTIELAHHWYASGDRAAALPAAIEAGLAAESLYAFPEASRQFERAIRLWDQPTGAAPAGGQAIGFRPPTGPALSYPDLLWRASESAHLAGSPATAIRYLHDLLERLDGTASPSDVARALARLGRYHRAAGELRESADAYQRAAELTITLPASAEGARIHLARARVLSQLGRYREARTVAEQGLADARTADSVSEERAALATLGVVLAGLGDLEGGLQVLVQSRGERTGRTSVSRVLPRPSRIGDIVLEYADRAAVHERAGDAQTAAAVLAEGSETARRLGVEASLGALLEANAVRALVARGEWAEADGRIGEALARGATPAATARLLVERARSRTATGSFTGAAADLTAAAERLGQAGDPRTTAALAVARADLELWQRRADGAARIVRDALDAVASEDPLAGLDLLVMGIRTAADRAESARSRRADAEVDRVMEDATPWIAEIRAATHRGRSSSATGTREADAQAAMAEAELTRAMGVPDPAVWASCAAMWDTLGRRPSATYARWRQAEAALSGRVARGDAAEVVRRAHAAATELGAEPLLAELEALARRARIDLEAPAGEPAPADPLRDRAHDLGITSRELEVLLLVAEGRTNRQIADALFITEKTAGHHVSNVLGKLGAASRVEAAAIAHRAGLVAPAAG